MLNFLRNTYAVLRRELTRLAHQPMYFVLMLVLPVVSFAFFVMVDIAAITSVVSLIEVVTQFVIQKFHVHRKRAALVVACVCFVVSIPIGISLGHVAILEESSPALFGLDWLTFFDEVTNTVLMPVCALFSLSLIHI